MKAKSYQKYSPQSIAAVLCFTFFLLFSPAAYSQDFSSLDSDLEALETLIADTLLNTQEQQKLLENLRQSLDASGNLIESYESIIAAREDSLRNLQDHLNEMSETYRMQSALSRKYEESLKFWKTFTLIAIPVTALISGGIVWAIGNGNL